ncbi:MAG: class I SAM-dependent methyltransferase [Chlorobi bacterium]|nr:class I SAM-dependent methyltransferase [Chlorobiota bacterium]
MNYLKSFRELYIKTTNFTHSYQGKSDKLKHFYKLWSYCYDLSVSLDPAFGREMKKMIENTVAQGDTVLDIGCGTGISTLYASKIAGKVVGIDLSPDMIHKLEQKIKRKKITNIDLVTGSFPEALPGNLKFKSIISSFAIVHFPPVQRKIIYKQIYDFLETNGRLGLFSAQGEIASSFETEKEVVANLNSAGFKNIALNNVSDIYRIITATKTLL